MRPIVPHQQNPSTPSSFRQAPSPGNLLPSPSPYHPASLNNTSVLPGTPQASSYSAVSRSTSFASSTQQHQQQPPSRSYIHPSALSPSAAQRPIVATSNAPPLNNVGSFQPKNLPLSPSTGPNSIAPVRPSLAGPQHAAPVRHSVTQSSVVPGTPISISNLGTGYQQQQPLQQQPSQQQQLPQQQYQQQNLSSSSSAGLGASSTSPSFEVSRLKTSLQNLTSQNSMLQDRVHSLEVQNSGLQNRIVGLEASNAQYAQLVHQLQQELASLQGGASASTTPSSHNTSTLRATGGQQINTNLPHSAAADQNMPLRPLPSIPPAGVNANGLTQRPQRTDTVSAAPGLPPPPPSDDDDSNTFGAPPPPPPPPTDDSSQFRGSTIRAPSGKFPEGTTSSTLVVRSHNNNNNQNNTTPAKNASSNLSSIGQSRRNAPFADNYCVDQRHAISPLEDDWDFSLTTPSTCLSGGDMSSIIQSTLEAWTEQFDFTKDAQDFFLAEITEIVEVSPSEQMVAKALEQLRYSLMSSQYHIVQKIGSGGFGSVFQGVDAQTHLPLAIKIVSLEDTDDDVLVISREITALVQGHSCPQLIRYYGSDVRNMKLWIFMEFVNGGSLLDHIKVEPLAERYVAVVAREVLLGLQYLNNEGKIHRDVKAANILLGTEGTVKLADFGASRALTDTISKANTFVGSPYWMSPDVILQKEYDGQSDIWSLGITCIELACGKPPHTDVNAMAALQIIIRDPPPKLVGNFSKDFKDFVAMCLIKDPTERATIADLLKTKFIKTAKKTKIITELFGGHEQ